MADPNSIGMERQRGEVGDPLTLRYLQELVAYGGVIWQRGFLLSRLQHDGEPEIILAAIDNRIARARARGRNPLEGAFFNAFLLPYADQVSLYDAMGAGDTATMNRLMGLNPAVQNPDPSGASAQGRACWDKDAN